MADVRSLVTDPEFQQFPLEERLAVLKKIGADPGFIDEYASLESSDTATEEPSAAPTPEAPKSFVDMLQQAGRDYVKSPLGVSAPAMRSKVEDVLESLHIPAQFTTPEASMESLPAVGGTIGAFFGNVPGAVLGGTGGEAARQHIRRLLGLPAATGVVQQATGMDPDSPEAAAAGLAIEGSMGPIGEGVSNLLQGFAKMTGRSSLRSLVNLLQPTKPLDRKKGLELAERMVSEDIAPALSFRSTQLERANQALKAAVQDLSTTEADLVAQGSTVPTQNVIDQVRGAIPGVLPGGQVPRSGRAARLAAERTLADVTDSTAGQADVPLSVAMQEKRRLDDMLRSIYERRGSTIPVSAESTKTAADAWRSEIHGLFPDLGLKDARVSDLITITKLLQDAHNEALLVGGLGTSSQEGAALGAGAVGRMSVPAMILAKAGISSGPWASLSAAGKRILAQVLEGGANSAQAWLRVADALNVPSYEELQENPELGMEPAEPTLPEALEATPGMMPPAAPKRLTPEEFMKRYQ